MISSTVVVSPLWLVAGLRMWGEGVVKRLVEFDKRLPAREP